MAQVSRPGDVTEAKLFCTEAIVISASGFRTATYNKKVGGVENSQHLTAKASDIKVYYYNVVSSSLKIQTFVDTKKVYDLIEFLAEEKLIKNGGLGIYEHFIHYDIRNTPARWNG